MLDTIQLSPEQNRILHLQSGRHLVAAPPGSGKTELLVQRLKLALSSGVRPEEMACLTFTNRAARSMQERIGDVPKSVYVGNFHAFAIKLLKGAGVLKSRYSVLDEEDSEEFLLHALADIIPDDPEIPVTSVDDPLLDHLENAIDPYTMKLIGLQSPPPHPIRPESWNGRTALQKRVLELAGLFFNHRFAVENTFPSRVTSRNLERLKIALGLSPVSAEPLRPFIWGIGILIGALERLHVRYAEIKRETLAVDFDDLLNLTLLYLMQKPESDLSVKLNWVQVDEAQDLNEIQWEILTRILTPEAHLVIFADPLQSIFSFLGGSLDRLNDAMHSFRIHRLRTNYRSPGYLIDFFKEYARTVLRESLAVAPFDNRCKYPESMQYLEFNTERDEYEYVSTVLLPVRLSGSDRTIAALTRTNESAQALSSTLSKAEIDHFKVSKFDLFRLRITKDFLAFLHVLQFPEARIPWIRILALSNPGLSLRKSLGVINQCFSSGILPHWFLDYEPPVYPPMDVMDRALNQRVVVFDTETTGLDLCRDDIIQFAAVEIVEGCIGRSLNLYLKTDRDVGDSIRVHRITNEFLKTNGEDRSRAFEQIESFIGDDPIVAHNLNFDYWMLSGNLNRIPGRNRRWLNPAFCTLQMSRALNPNVSSHKLENLIKHYAIDAMNAHNALDDATATARLLLAMRGQVVQNHLRVESFWKEHGKLIEKTRLHYGPFREMCQSAWLESCSFEDLYGMTGFCESDYEPSHLDEFKNKLLRHMKRTVAHKPLFRLMAEDLPAYLIYKEPDLILDDDRVVVSTVHRAKGLEFDTVLIANCHSNSFPTYPARREATGRSMEEEARLLYVAMTRAKDHLFVSQPSFITTRQGKAMSVECSPFLKGLKMHFTCRDFRKKP